MHNVTCVTLKFKQNKFKYYISFKKALHSENLKPPLCDETLNNQHVKQRETNNG